MNSNHNISAEELWQKIITIKTTQEWMELTHGFSIFTIYHHCRILQDPEKIETYQCMIRKEYPKSLEKFDEKDPSVVCYMMMGNGNLRRSSNPSFFDRLVDEGVRSAHNDGPYTVEEKEEDATEEETLPVQVQIATILAMLDKLGCNFQNSDKSKIIKLICALTGRTAPYVSKRIYDGALLSKQHKTTIQNMNKIFEGLNLDISIEFDRKK